MEDPESRISRDELVDRAGVESSLVERLCDLAILTPDDEGRFGASDVYRVRLVAACERGGMGAEAIARAIGDGRLSLAFLDRPQYRWAALGSETFGELAERLDLPFDLVRGVAGALGRRRPAAQDRTREDDGAIFELIRLIFPMVDADAIVRIGRVYTDGLRRMAEAESTVFDTYLVGGLMRTGLSYPEAIERASAAGAEMTPLMERMVLALYRRQQERGWTEGIVERIEAVIEETGLTRGTERPTTLAFVDLAGYTRITDELGDEAGARLASELADLVDRESAEHDGTPVKWLGDGVMVHFRDAASAVRATLAVVARAPSIGLPAHAGVAAGPVVMQDGDYFGRTVNLAARVAARAEAGQTLVTDRVAELADGSGSTFREVGPVELKGFAEPVILYEASAGG
jgi:class 3 adenylate cyclase